MDGRTLKPSHPSSTSAYEPVELDGDPEPFRQEAVAPDPSAFRTSPCSPSTVPFVSNAAQVPPLILPNLLSEKFKYTPTNSNRTGVRVIVDNLSYRRGLKPILDTVSFVAEPGTLVGILGASGSGKTTLLNVIGGRVPRRGIVSGEVRFLRGSPPPAAPRKAPIERAFAFFSPRGDMRRRSSLNQFTGCCGLGGILAGSGVSDKAEKTFLLGFVPAFSEFPPRLTIREIAFFSAHLCLGPVGRSAARRAAQDALELAEVEDARADATTAAQRKRLALALEYLKSPEVILLDEPTSGLDVSQSHRMISFLRDRSRASNETVICSIHQPRASVRVPTSPCISFLQTFRLFDEVLILTSKGEVAYFGAPSNLIAYFGALGFVAPRDLGIACFALEVVAEPSRFAADSPTVRPLKAEVPGKRGEAFPEPFGASSDSLVGAFRSSREGRSLQAKLMVSNTDAGTKVSGEGVSGSGVECHEVYPVNRLKKCTCKEWFDELIILLRRHALIRWRHLEIFLGVLLCCVVEALLIGWIFWQAASTNSRPVQFSDTVADFVQKIDQPNSLVHRFVNQGLTALEPLPSIVDYGVNGRGRGTLDTIARMNISMDTASSLLKNATDYFHDYFNLTTDYGYPSVASDHFLSVHQLPTPLSEDVKTIIKSLQLFDFFYFKYDFSNLEICNKYFGEAKFNLCYYLKLNKLSRAFLKYLDFPYPTSLLRYLKIFDFVNWPDDGPTEVTHSVSHRNKTKLQPLPIDLDNDGLLGELPTLDDLFKALDHFQLQPFIRKTFGQDFLDLIKPAYRWLTTFNNCKHPLCKKIVSGVGSLKDLLSPLAPLAVESINSGNTLLDICGIIFFVCIILGMGAYEVLVTFPMERKLLNQERSGGRVSTSTFYLSKLFADLPFAILCSSVIAVVLYFMAGFNSIGTPAHQGKQFVIYWALAILIQFAAYGFAYLVSALVPTSTPQLSILIAPIFLILWIAIAGFFLRSNEVPAWASWLNYLSFLHWGFNAHMTNLLPLGGSFGTLPNELCRGLAGVTYSNIGLAALFIFLLGLLYRLLGYLCLKFLYTKN